VQALLPAIAHEEIEKLERDNRSAQEDEEVCQHEGVLPNSGYNRSIPSILHSGICRLRILFYTSSLPAVMVSRSCTAWTVSASILFLMIPYAPCGQSFHRNFRNRSGLSFVVAN